MLAAPRIAHVALVIGKYLGFGLVDRTNNRVCVPAFRGNVPPVVNNKPNFYARGFCVSCFHCGMSPVV